MSPISSCGAPRLCECRDVHQIVGDDTEADPSVHAVFAMVAAAVESVSAFEHTDAAFTADTPPLSPTEPALAFVRASRRRLGATTREHHSANAPFGRRPFVRRRTEAAILGSEIGARPKIGCEPR